MARYALIAAFAPADRVRTHLGCSSDHEIRGIELCPERQRGEAIGVRPLVLRHARERGFADADLARHLAPRGRALFALRIDRLVKLLEVEFHGPEFQAQA